MWLVLIVMLFLTIKQGELFGTQLFSALQRPLAAALTFQRDDYFDIGGGTKTGPEIAWLGSYAPTPESLTVSDYEALTKAVADDSAKHGLDAGAYEAVFDLPTQPMVTRPAKAFAENSKELRNGIVAVPEDGRDIVIAAYVEAKWALAVVRNGQCATLVGPSVKGCTDQTRNNGRWSNTAMERINSLKPKD
jgi:hypothetical protein